MTQIHRYHFEAGVPQRAAVDSVPSVLTIDDYLRAHLESYAVTGPANAPGGDFEIAVAKALNGAVDELSPGVKPAGALEIDLVVRCGNRVGICEVKSGKKSGTKEGIDQLATAGGREFLGTYTTRFLIVDREWKDRTNLMELAEAREVVLIELPGYHDGQHLDDKDAKTLRDRVRQRLGCVGGGA